ncbi:MAG TPA: energy transducer TonB [Gemmatimonadaceae bacterium]|jgi:protein TonB
MKGVVINSGQTGYPHFRSLAFAVAAVAMVATACVDKEQSEKMAKTFEAGPQHPDEAPKMLNKELPFHYPPALFAKKVQGNVTLRLFIDRDGHVRSDSTQVVESSGYASFDSAAIRGSQDLQFVPAKMKGEPLAVTILFPVYFRFPGAPPLPGDTVLKKKGARD